MDIFELLDNLLCKNELLSLVSVNDLLRLRRVSKVFKSQVEDFVRCKKVQTRRTLVIDFEDDAPLKDFQNSIRCLPTRTTLHIIRLTNNFKLDQLSTSVRALLEAYGNTTTNLSFDAIEAPFNSGILEFFKLFPNVTGLEITEIEPHPSDDDMVPAAADDESSITEDIIFPISFKNLKRLRINDGITMGSEVAMQNAFRFIAKLVELCIPNLERLWLVFYKLGLVEDAAGWENIARLACTCLFGTPTLKLASMDGCLMEELLLQRENRLPEMRTVDTMIHNMNSKLISLRFPYFETCHVDFPNLEAIDCVLYSVTSLPSHIPLSRRTWPKLRRIKLGVLHDVDNWSAQSFHHPWQILFGGIRREHVTKLDITTEVELEANEIFPRTQDIATSCPNLKILHLGSFALGLVNLSELWGGLPLLEKVHLDNCYGLKDDDFLGVDAQNPAFINLQHLKVLKLEGLLETTPITDLLFSQVLRLMPLKELFVSSRGPVESITLDGIKSLLTGKFATSIERLSLDGLKLNGVSSKEMKSAQNLFRSSQMI